jgi:hypothetical protein
VQLCSAISLARLGDARARATLLDFLAARLEIERSDDHRELRLDALERLADVGFSPEATTVLASLAWRLLPSAERDVARAVLAGFGDARALRALLDQLASRWAAQRQAGVSLARVGKVREATARLVALLDDGAVDPYSVVDALGSIGGREADAALEAVAREEHREDELRERARTLIRRRANPLG